MSLERYFSVMVPFLAGEGKAEDVIAELGDTPSSPKRFRFYQQLMIANRRRVMRAVFPSVEHILGAGKFEAMIDRFTRERPVMHWDLNYFGEPFSEWLEAQRQASDAIPSYLEELADYHWLEYALKSDGRSFDPATHLVNPVLEARRYSWDAPAFVQAVRMKTAERSPEKKERLVLIFRDPRDLRIKVYDPTLAGLVALGVLSGETPPTAFAESGLDRETVLSEVAAFRAFQIFGDGAVEAIEACW